MAHAAKKQPKGGHGPKGPKPKNTKATFSRLLGYLGKSKIMLVFVFIFVIFSALAGIIGTSFVETITDDILLPIIGSEITKELLAPLVKILVSLGFIYLFGVISSYAYSRIMLQVAQKTLTIIRKDLFDHMMDLPISFFDTHTHGELMSRYTNDADVLRECISQSFVQLVSSIATVIGTFVMMLYYSPALTLFVVAMLFVAFFVIRILGGQSAKYFRAQQKCVGDVNGYIEEYIEGLKVVKVFCHEDEANNGFGIINGNLRHAATNAHTFASILMPIMGNMSYITYAATATIGSVLIMTVPEESFFGISVGALFTFLIYTRQFFQPITQISQQFNNIIAALAGAERIFEVIDTPVEEDEGYVTLVNAKKLENGEIVECEERTGIWAWKHPHGDGTLTYTEWKGDVRFHDVTFSYDGKKTVLKNVSLYARPGEKIAFVGSTGAGKTTITNLINRFYDVNEGKITYDGINIKKIKKAELRRSMAMVLQDTHLFTGTVRDNIAYGRLDATDEEIVAAAKLANAHSFITRLPDGYDTMITGDGANLSQGQRQLLAIARAAVADPPVLILDEATSSIDTRTERLIEKGMDKLMEGRTVFVIAHRLSTVRNSNAIMVLENGEIIERGDHDDLIAQKGKYYQLYTGQFELD
ncbi:MAG: ABC transporter ATP-binding protein [Clostridia bacterium]|nr:ABC transporter ATP-binding protein [Clostridia bacterium]